jgi:hypothetical protein
MVLSLRLREDELNILNPFFLEVNLLRAASDSYGFQRVLEGCYIRSLRN